MAGHHEGPSGDVTGREPGYEADHKAAVNLLAANVAKWDPSFDANIPPGQRYWTARHRNKKTAAEESTVKISVPAEANQLYADLAATVESAGEPPKVEAPIGEEITEDKVVGDIVSRPVFAHEFMPSRFKPPYNPRLDGPSATEAAPAPAPNDAGPAAPSA